MCENRFAATMDSFLLKRGQEIRGHECNLATAATVATLNKERRPSVIFSSLFFRCFFHILFFAKKRERVDLCITASMNIYARSCTNQHTLTHAPIAYCGDRYVIRAKRNHQTTRRNTKFIDFCEIFQLGMGKNRK